MSIERKIESKMVEHLKGIVGDAVKVRGSWQAATMGEVKDLESDIEPMLDVRLRPASFPSYSSPVGEWSTLLALYVPVALDPSGEMLDEIWSKLSAWILAAQVSLSSVKAALDIAGEFTAHGFIAQGGEGPDIIDGERIVTLSCVVRGRYLHN